MRVSFASLREDFARGRICVLKIDLQKLLRSYVGLRLCKWSKRPSFVVAPCGDRPVHVDTAFEIAAMFASVSDLPSSSRLEYSIPRHSMEEIAMAGQDTKFLGQNLEVV